MARPTRVMAKQVTATSAISGPTAAISARGSADAVVVMARAFWAFTAGAANWAFTDLFRRTSEERNEERWKETSVVLNRDAKNAKTRDCQVAGCVAPSARGDKGRFELRGTARGGTHTRAERFLPAGATARVELRGERGWGRTVSRTRGLIERGPRECPLIRGAEADSRPRWMESSARHPTGERRVSIARAPRRAPASAMAGTRFASRRSRPHQLVRALPVPIGPRAPSSRRRENRRARCDPGPDARRAGGIDPRRLARRSRVARTGGRRWRGQRRGGQPRRTW